jgi:hypothetical protein
LRQKIYKQKCNMSFAFVCRIKGKNCLLLISSFQKIDFSIVSIVLILIGLITF